MKILGKQSGFLNRFFLIFSVMLCFYICVAVVTESAIWILFSPILLLPVCVLITQKLEETSYEAHDLVFDASGVTMYDGQQMVQHKEWEEYKTRCIVSHRGKPEWFYFSHEPLYIGSILRTQYLYHFGTRGRGTGFYSTSDDIGFQCTPERYAAFRKSCPEVKVLQIDTCGEIYVITDAGVKILIARILRPDLVIESREEDTQCTLEILQAIETVRAADMERSETLRGETALTQEEIPVFQESDITRFDILREKEKQRREDKKWFEEFKTQILREEHIFEIMEFSQAVIEEPVVEETAEETIEETVFPEESAEEELEDVRIPGVRSVEEILASASRTVESVRGLGSRFREEDASAEVDDTWEEESFFDEDME